MAIKSVKKSWGSGNRNINYVGKDFSAFRQNLIDYTKTYFPDTYSDFNQASPGMLFIELMASLGDILSYYQDTQLKESLLPYATEKKNILALAQSAGYRPKVTTPAVTTITVYQLVPSIYNTNGNSGTNYEPDSNYYLKIKSGMQIRSKENSSIVFRTTDVVDFSNDTNREIQVYQSEAVTGAPELYLVTKQVQAISATIIETTISVPSSDTDYPTITLSDTNIIGIESVVETTTNTEWHEVPYLAQESIFVEVPNTDYNSELSQYSGTVPYILEVQKVPNRFSIRVNTDNSITLQFGNGNSTQYDEIVLPNTKNVGLGLASSIERLNSGIDPSNFLKTNTLGLSPAGKNFTIKYLVGGGVQSNVNSSTLTSISNVEFEEDLLSISNTGLYNTIKQSVAVENMEAATGGRGAESVEEIRQNALATFGSQNRAVTRQDYIVRALSMPERYGSVAKVYVSPDTETDSSTTNNQVVTNNPYAINMYVLGYDNNKKLTSLNQAVKQNLKTYLTEYRMLTDAVNMLDGFIVNIGVNFEITTYAGYNKSEVLSDCLNQLKDYFDIDNWTFNKPINISDMELLLANIEGVMSVAKVEVVNLTEGDGGYSKYIYDFNAAKVGKIIYPSLDPCVFEVKYPNADIKGRVI
jgi:phage-related baseplate assembly protein